MEKSLKKFMAIETRSRAKILNRHYVEVQTPDGEIFEIISDIDKYNSDEYKSYVLHLIEFIFDRNFSDDKEQMIYRISRDFLINAVPSMGMDSGSRHAERVRIGSRIRELREAKKMEARDLAILAGKSFFDQYMKLGAASAAMKENISKGNRLFVRGLMEMEPNKAWAPNANSTIRLTYGKVRSYQPRDGVFYKHYTTMFLFCQEDNSIFYLFFKIVISYC